jgi:hypothetical protein
MAKFLLIQNYEGGVCDQPMGTWDPGDVRAPTNRESAFRARPAGTGFRTPPGRRKRSLVPQL